MLKQHEAEDILACARAGRTPRSHGPYQIQIGDALLKFRAVPIDDPVPTGRQILRAAEVMRVEEHMVFQVLRGWELEELRLDETTDLRAGRVERFLVFEGAESFRFELDDRVLEWGAAEITGAVLKRLAGVDPDTHDLWLDERGAQGRRSAAIAPEARVRLDGKGLERFFTAQCADSGSLAAAEVTISVNGTTIEMIGGQHTGAEIKQAAIDAGVRMDLDFVLMLETGPSDTDTISDQQAVEIKCGTCFQAIADDDNS